MSFIINAPFPAFAVKSYLPNPQLGDSLASTGSVALKRAMNGVKYAYVLSRDKRKKLIWNFTLSQHKALELQALFDAYGAEKIKITDHIGKIYIGNFTNNPFEFEATRRAVAAPGNDSQHAIQIEFEGFEQTP